MDIPYLLESAGIGLGVATALGIGKLLLGRRKKSKQPPEPVLLNLTPHDAVTLHQAYEGVLIMGGTGSGKTTGPGDHLARSLLQQGAGFCVLCAKPDECARWIRLVQETGRTGDFVRFAPGSGVTCDILNYELSHGEATVEAAAQLLSLLVEVESRQSEGRGDEQFWKLASEKHFRRAIHAVWRGKGKCSLTDVYKFIVSAPNSPEEVASDAWRRDSFCAECLLEASAKYPDDYDFRLTADYWLVEVPALSEKTRSVIFAMTTNVLDKFLFGDVARMISSGETNFTPELIHDGAIGVLDMPYLKWREPGRFFQILFKTLVQRSTLRRDVSQSPRPVVIWADEAQFFVVPSVDAMTQTVARQARLISVAITQNLPILFSAQGGGEKARQDVEGWIANHQTKILCANACKETNEFFSELLGHSKHLFMNGSTGTDQPYDLVGDFIGQPQGHVNAGFSEQWHPDVPPGAFTRLAKGGKEAGFVVEVYCFQGGRRFSNGKTWIRGSFQQRV